MSVWTSSNFFEIANAPPTVFVLVPQNLAHMIYVPVCKKMCDTDFWNFDFKIFWRICYILNLAYSSEAI